MSRKREVAHVDGNDEIESSAKKRGKVEVISGGAVPQDDEMLIQAMELVKKVRNNLGPLTRAPELAEKLQQLSFEVDKLHYGMFLPKEEEAASPEGETIFARTWPELLRSLELNSWSKYHRSYNSSFVFRGMPTSEYALNTSLQRLGHGIGSETEIETEKAIMRSFKNYAHGALTGKADLFEWLTLAQHHGCPTRVMDFTYSPLVALHFATSDPSKDDEDGVVYCVEPKKCMEASKTYISTFKKWKKQAHDSYWSVARTNQIISLLNVAQNTKPGDLEHIGPNNASSIQLFEKLELLGDSLVFIEAPALHQRVVNQNHVFGFLTRKDKSIDQWLNENKSGTFRKVVVSKYLKAEVRARLHNFAVTERLLFPGLDGTGKWLKSYYTHSSISTHSYPKPAISP